MNEKILLVDDEVNVLQAYRRAFHKRFKLHTASSGQEALDMITADGPYAVVVSDMRMPGMNGIELLQKLRTITPHTVRIMLTGNADQKTAVEAVNSGQVYRFLNKPCSIETMAEALQDALTLYDQTASERERNSQNAQAVEELSKRLSHQARHDVLTGLHNRPAFEEALEQLLDAPPSATDHALIYLDLDLFRVINTSAGPVAGDALLRQTAQILAGACGSQDVLARTSSDEFSLLLKNRSVAEARRLGEDINIRLHGIGFQWDGQDYDISACMGIVPITHDERRKASDVLGTAETACNVAKENGRGQLHVGSPSDPELTRHFNEMQWVGRIGQALQSDRFRLYYQTISPLQTNDEGEHYELLLRLEEEDGTIIQPDSFLPAAEHYHLSPMIDRWVVRTLVRWLMDNPQALQRLSVCSINLSGHSLGNAEVLTAIRDIFSNSHVPSHKICFEITETAAIANLNNATQFIKELKQEGFLFSLDDFGSGLSSFAYLRNLPVDYLKIDGVFVKNIAQDPIDQAMVRAISEVARVMHKKTVAEFVDNEDTVKILRDIGIDYVQGYYLSRPQPLAQLADAPAEQDISNR
jgi:diguanylate cyclase (GGDEF)-like protein